PDSRTALDAGTHGRGEERGARLNSNLPHEVALGTNQFPDIVLIKPSRGNAHTSAQFEFIRTVEEQMDGDDAAGIRDAAAVDSHKLSGIEPRFEVTQRFTEQVFPGTAMK